MAENLRVLQPIPVRIPLRHWMLQARPSSHLAACLVLPHLLPQRRLAQWIAPREHWLEQFPIPKHLAAIAAEEERQGAEQAAQLRRAQEAEPLAEEAEEALRPKKLASPEDHFEAEAAGQRVWQVSHSPAMDWVRLAGQTAIQFPHSFAHPQWHDQLALHHQMAILLLRRIDLHAEAAEGRTKAKMEALMPVENSYESCLLFSRPGSMSPSSLEAEVMGRRPKSLD